MSVCDVGWGQQLCPCFIETGLCGILGVTEVGINSCPHAAALSAVLENPELVLVAVERASFTCARADFTDPGGCNPEATVCPCNKWEFDAR